MAAAQGRAEFNIEGDPRPDLIDLALETQPRSVHARAGDARRDHEPGRLAAETLPAARSTASIRRLRRAAFA